MDNIPGDDSSAPPRGDEDSDIAGILGSDETVKEVLAAVCPDPMHSPPVPILASFLQVYDLFELTTHVHSGRPPRPPERTPLLGAGRTVPAQAPSRRCHPLRHLSPNARRDVEISSGD